MQSVQLSFEVMQAGLFGFSSLVSKTAVKINAVGSVSIKDNSKELWLVGFEEPFLQGAVDLSVKKVSVILTHDR